MNQYLRLIPFGLIYVALVFVFVPRTEGKFAKFFTIVVLIPIAYFLSGYVDQYLPTLFYRFQNYFNF